MEGIIIWSQLNRKDCPFFYPCLSKVLTNERRCYICNISSQWLIHCKDTYMRLKMGSSNCNHAYGTKTWEQKTYIDGLVQDCSNSIVNAMKLLESCVKPTLYSTSVSCLVQSFNVILAFGVRFDVRHLSQTCSCTYIHLCSVLSPCRQWAPWSGQGWVTVTWWYHVSS